jgi:NADH-quinone oxidoreductase subunit A
MEYLFTINNENKYLLIAITISAIISIILTVITLVLNYQFKVNYETSSPYECGFNPFAESRYRFDIKFYLVSILFIIFDVEIVFLFPFCHSLLVITSFSFYCVLFFLFILFLGIVIEIRKKAISF